MPLCGFNAKMIQGISIFAQGLFEAVLERAKEKNVPIEQAFNDEIKDLGMFLESLEEKYQELRLHHQTPQVMREVVDWMAKRS